MFVLRAVDNRGGLSPRVIRAFYAYTVAPDAKITRPVPNIFFPASVPVSFRVDWSGHDPDGEGDGRPVAYRIRILDLGDPANVTFLADPDSLRRVAIATGWEGWRTISGDTTSAIVTPADVGTGDEDLFALVAVDAAGASTPYMSMNDNLLVFRQSFGTSGPRIHIISPYVNFSYESGGYSDDPMREIPIEVFSGVWLDFGWDAIAAPGRVPESSRWRVDGNLADEAGWSARGPASQQVRVPPLAAGIHRLYVEVRDDFGELSLGIVRITVVTGEFGEQLLVVDDTRREADKFPGGQLATYTQPYPSASELDTLLYARGGFPWRGARNPVGALSVPGLLAGYPFDTLGTRLGLEIPSTGVTLSRLSRYRHVLWMVDERAATFRESGDQMLFPVTALAAMSRPGSFNVIASYIAGGGQVWFAGGGTAFASLLNYDRLTNNSSGVTVFANAMGELGPGRTLYDHGHLRSTIAVTKTPAEPQRSAAARGGWSGHGPDGTLASPDYTKLPVSMRFRTAASEAMPPTRVASQAASYYPTNGPNEVIAAPNEIVESFGSGDPPSLESALDTLYEVSSPSLPISPAPTMLYYHGRENPPFLFTGFDLWSWRREDCQALVDFVLSDLWGLAKTGPRAASAHAAAGADRSTTTRPRVMPPPHPARALARVPIRR